MKKPFLLFAVSVGILSFIPSVISFGANSSVRCVSALDDEHDPSFEDSCTVMYVGKDVSENGLPIVCRTGDGRNSLIYHSLKRYKKDEFANKNMEGGNGFSWKMPEHTYAFTGFPRSSSVGHTLHWDVSTMNECGLAVSATLSCKSDDERVLEYDPFIKDGISEDNIAGIIAASCATAREGIEYLANILDKKGSAEANIVLTLDQNEAWLMEIYSGYQYCAIKLPNDKATTIGNEFFLNTLVDYPDGDIITSPNLFSLPKEKGFAVFDGGTGDKNMHLFNTYAKPLVADDENDAIRIDASHMRTWRGRDLFAKEAEKKDYQTSLKYEPFFSPERNLSINDCFVYFRDSYQNLLDNPDPKYDLFRLRKEQGRLRCVAVETSYQVHVMMSHNDLPKEMAVEAWICMGNAYASPFVPFNNSMTNFPEEYTHEINNYGPDEKSAHYIYRRISAIADLYRKEYAEPIQKAWNIFEDIWKKQYDSCLNKAHQLISENKKDDASSLLNNYLFDVQTKALYEAKHMADDLLAHYMKEQNGYKQQITDYVPKTNIIAFADMYGYKHEIKDNIFKLTNDKKTVEINFKGINSFDDATISCGGDEDNFKMSVIDNEYFGDIELLNKYLAKDSSLGGLNFDELINRGNSKLTFLYILIPVLLVIILGTVVAVILIRTKKRKLNSEK